MPRSGPPTTIFELYRSFKGQGGDSEHTHSVLTQAHWFASHADFDPKTGEALPQELTTFLAKLAKPVPAVPLRDRVWRITEHARPAVERLMQTLNETPRREHALLPVRSVRELDAGSFIKLSNRPGRTIREKLAGKPYLQAVRRFQSIDLPENRLLKAFLTRLVELLEFRRDYLGEQEDELVPRGHSWLLSDEGKAIGRWENLPPNNTLLAHRDYRRIWDAWRWMQTLDDDIAQDFAQLDAREETMQFWMDLGQMYRKGEHLFADMPVLFDYDVFTIRTWSPEPIVRKAARTIHRSTPKRAVAQAVCLDLAEVRPRFADSPTGSQALTETYLWQQWKNDSDTIDIALFKSDAAFLHPDATTIALPDLFFTDDSIPDHLRDRAARAFASQLRDTFTHDTLIWLVPDALNDFELDIIRRNLNARFPGSEPLPRAIAALFEQVDYARVTRDGYSVVVLDTLGGITCATKLVARFDTDLRNRLPETRGYYWERCPPVVLSKHDGIDEQRYDTVTVDATGKWHDKTLPERPEFIDPQRLTADPRIGHVAFCINVSNSPVAGGMRLHAFQARAGDIPLWRDQIPELAIKGYIDGFYLRFYLLSRGRTIEPIRSRAMRIPITERFTLPAGKRSYEFPLYQGENAAELRFSARLESPAFPLKTNTECDLILTFEYGDDEPYTLVFAPLDNSFPPVRVTWQRTEEVVITDAPAPVFPPTVSWDDLRHFPDVKRSRTTNLIQEMRSTTRNLNRWLQRNDDEAWGVIKRNMKGWCRFLFFSVWRDGRSLSDSGCSTECGRAAIDLLDALRRVIAHPHAHEYGILQYDMMVLLSAMHKDTPDDCVSWMFEQVECGLIRNHRAVGFALGDLSQHWQAYLLYLLLSHNDERALDPFAYAIWRAQKFLDRLSLVELQTLLTPLRVRLATLQPQQYADGIAIRAQPLELLLGLLRTRASADPDIRMLLQPHQKITKQCAEQIDRIEGIVAESGATLFSRVQINIQKPEGVRTPDLLYALRLYLTGSDGANAIHITGISDTDDD